MKTGWVYVLQCENGKFYVGRTVRGDAGISCHINVRKSSWTSLHIPIRCIYKEHTTNVRARTLALTLECMKIYGVENVRGYAWSQRVLSSKTLRHLSNLVSSIE